MKNLHDSAAVQFEAEKLLRRLGLSEKYDGYFFLAYAVTMTVTDSAAVGLRVTKEIYPGIARLCRSNISAVERNIRTAIRALWTNCDRNVLEEVAGTHLERRPTNSEMINILARYIRNEHM